MRRGCFSRCQVIFAPELPLDRHASMISSLKYGANAALNFELPANVLVANCAAPVGMDDAQTVASAQAATQTPLDFPPLRQATVPGDHVVIAVGPSVPQAPDVVAAILP